MTQQLEELIELAEFVEKNLSPNFAHDREIVPLSAATLAAIPALKEAVEKIKRYEKLEGKPHDQR